MPAPDDEIAVLRAVVRRSRSQLARSAWDALCDARQLFAAAATYFLLDVAPDSDVESFACVTLRRLLQYLSRTTEQRQMEYQGRVRGRVIWPATYKVRYGEDYDPTRFVCREVCHEFDTLENQLVRYLVERIGECLKAVPHILRTGTCYFEESSGQVRRSCLTAERLSSIEFALNQFRRNVLVRQITLPSQVGPQHLLRAERARSEEYHAVAQLYEHYWHTVTPPSPQRISAIGRRVLPLPERLRPDAEVWLELGAEILRSPG